AAQSADEVGGVGGVHGDLRWPNRDAITNVHCGLKSGRVVEQGAVEIKECSRRAGAEILPIGGRAWAPSDVALGIPPQICRGAAESQIHLPKRIVVAEGRRESAAADDGH